MPRLRRFRGVWHVHQHVKKQSTIQPVSELNGVSEKGDLPC
ncbi:hypothetical protein LC2W_1237 [Lacticaseibacillus paracasei]|uniref:Uncharacterized protein n=1 Tax=Lacticaseibacillus paracasei subsp. paracasei TaxID=47714 RepID=A0AAP9HG84_LACPA|nr:hypothetical protein LC2W_1237 [Lacticaseibacillus paracasei]EPC22388.1 hypothetical protein Lpp226_0527 [Lacticaseibacillus paracasei subsp. paracasei Lpp226]EPC31891.1 hypothetical protein Lpp223_2284 [Lacticaseibacillus paracasei subsp. paracasei Lpp223]QGV17783.1 Hypothetical protein LCAKO_1251 [Lacticaseibacillus paracasei subsp. paracasei]EKQ27981.1 hypothetical protein LCALC10_1028 [Lacticaseibacillus paracasei]